MAQPLVAELPKEMQSLQLRPLFIFRINVNKPRAIGQTPSIDRRVGDRIAREQCRGGGDRPPAGERADLPGVRGAVIFNLS